MTQTPKNTSQLDEFSTLLDQAREYAGEYINAAHEQSLSPGATALARLSEFDTSLPDGPTDASEMLAQLHDIGSPTTLPSTGGRYFGFVNGGAHPPALAAKWLSDIWDQNAAFYVMSPIAAKLEEVCERWIVELLGLPNQTVAGFVGGTSTAIAAGLVTARNELLTRQGWDVATRGLFGAPEIRVVVGAQAHGAVYKALSYIGLGRERVEVVPSDDQGRMIAGKMPALDARTLVVAQAGDVNSGAFDPLNEICDKAQKAGAWVHVDGAFGLWAAASRNKRSLLRGFEKADSWAVDAHKTLNAPYDCGIILCRHPEKLASAMQASGSYLQRTDGQRDGMYYVPEMSRRARATELWALLKTMGRSGVEELVDRLCSHAQNLANGLKTNGFQIKNDVVFNQVLVACDTPALTQTVLTNIQTEGEIWCGGAIWHNNPVIRVSICSWATTPSDIERAVTAFCTARERAKTWL